MIAVKAVQDESSHWYLVPNDELREFDILSGDISDLDDDSKEYYDKIEEFEKLFSKYRTGGDLNNVQLYVDSVLTSSKENMVENEDYEYQKLPTKFTHDYLTNSEVDSFRCIDYDDSVEYDKESHSKYYEHFFQLNNMLKFAFRYYSTLKKIGNIYIMDDEGENVWFENSWCKFKILNDLIKEFDISKNRFNWDFDFEKYEY
jgi:hypothetical protein